MQPDSGQEELHSENVRVLGRIASICRKNGIDLLLLSTPSVRNWNMKRHNTMAGLAADLNEKARKEGTTVEYVDMNLMTDEIPIDWDQDTRDEGDHLNNSGVEKVCAWLGPWLKEHYSLTDHRDDPACQKTWTGMYEEYLDWISGNRSNSSLNE